MRGQLWQLSHELDAPDKTDLLTEDLEDCLPELPSNRYNRIEWIHYYAQRFMVCKALQRQLRSPMINPSQKAGLISYNRKSNRYKPFGLNPSNS